MSSVHSNSRPRPSQGEAPMALDEVFYSLTDPRGVIRSCNDVFCRVADYPADKLMGAPHKIIRHPDMPKGVFRLMWDRIQAGKITGAYVKNRARDGLYYWVYAVVNPIDDGYLSVRIKPTSPLLAVAVREYAALLAAEADGLDPAQSALALVARLAELGHPDYDSFMAASLGAELTAPRRAAVIRPDPALAQIDAMTTALTEVMAEKGELLKGFDKIRDIPMNLHITASRIEAYGGPVATLAENYRLMAGEVTLALHQIVGDGKSGSGSGSGSASGLGEAMIQAVSEARFRIGTAQVMEEVVRTRRGDVPPDGTEQREERRLLEVLRDRHAISANANMANVVRISAKLVAVCDDLRRLMLGLDSIRVLCRVEAGRMGLNRSTLQSIIDQLENFHGAIEGRLARINDLAAGIRGLAVSARDGPRIAA